MKCFDVFSDRVGDKGVIVRNSEGGIEKVVLPDGADSPLWAKLAGMTDAKIKKLVKNDFDKGYITAIKEGVANFGSFGDTANDLRFALYSKIYSDKSNNQFGESDTEPAFDENLEAINSTGNVVTLTGDGNVGKKIEPAGQMPSAIAALKMVLGRAGKSKAAALKILGKSHAADAESQLLSAATDNAKELILGKIGANEHTNGVITAMLIMGYDLDTILDFLQDSDVQSVFAYLQELKNKGRIVRLSKQVIKDTGIEGDSIDTLKKLVEVSSSIMAFGGIRSLSENFKIDSATLDRIFDGIDHDILYEAIQEEDVDIIYVKGQKAKMRKKIEYLEKGYDPAKNNNIPFKDHLKVLQDEKSELLDIDKDAGIFDSELLIYYHPQSRMIFKRLYELEQHILPGMFPSRKAVNAFVGNKHRTETTYKKVTRYMGEAQVVMFLSSTKPTATLLDSTGKPVHYDLSITENREKLIAEFPNYIDKVQAIFKSLGIESMALDNMDSITAVSGGTHQIKMINGLKSGVQSDHFKKALAQSIKELAVEIKGIDSPQAVKLKLQLYNNLALYSLLVSGGVVGKGNMIDMFPEISMDLSTYVSSLTEGTYNSLLDVENDQLKGLILDTLIDPTLKARNESEEVSDKFVDDHLIRDDQEQRPGEHLQTATNPDSTAANFRYIRGWDGLIYKDAKTGTEFVGVSKKANNGTPFRIFPKTSKEAIGIEFGTPPGPNDWGTIGKFVKAKVEWNLARVGKQVGYNVKINGKPAKVLNYIKECSSNQKVNGVGYSIYGVLYEGSIVEMPGPVIMSQNRHAGLFKQTIGYRTPSVNRQLAASKILREMSAINEKRGGSFKAVKLRGLDTLAISSDLKAKLQGTYILDEEAAMLGKYGGNSILVSENDTSKRAKKYLELKENIPSSDYVLPTLGLDMFSKTAMDEAKNAHIDARVDEFTAMIKNSIVTELSGEGDVIRIHSTAKNGANLNGGPNPYGGDILARIETLLRADQDINGVVGISMEKKGKSEYVLTLTSTKEPVVSYKGEKLNYNMDASGSVVFTDGSGEVISLDKQQIKSRVLHIMANGGGRNLYGGRNTVVDTGKNSYIYFENAGKEFVFKKDGESYSFMPKGQFTKIVSDVTASGKAILDSKGITKLKCN